MKPHEIIEVIFTNVCAIHGLKWVDVINCTNSTKGKETYFESRFMITHLLSRYLSEAAAMDIMKYNKPMIYYSSKRYLGIRHKYRDMETIIHNKITYSAKRKAARQ